MQYHENLKVDVLDSDRQDRAKYDEETGAAQTYFSPYLRVCRLAATWS